MRDLTKGRPMQQILLFLLPILIGNILQLTYSLVDTRVVGSVLGDTALAAVGATTSLSTMVIGFLQGLTNGFAVIIARFFGAGDQKGLKRSVAASVTLAFAVGLTLTVLTIACLPQILGVLHVGSDIYAMSYSYIIVIFAGMTIAMLYNLCAAMLRAIGDSVTPLIFLGISVVLNIFGDLRAGYGRARSCGSDCGSAAVCNGIMPAIYLQKIRTAAYRKGGFCFFKETCGRTAGLRIVHGIYGMSGEYRLGSIADRHQYAGQ